MLQGVAWFMDSAGFIHARGVDDPGPPVPALLGYSALDPGGLVLALEIVEHQRSGATPAASPPSAWPQS